MLEVVGAHRVRVEVDAAEVDDPGEGRGIGHDDLFGRIARRVVQCRGLDPVGTLLGSALLEERLLRDALHEPLQHHRPAVDAAQGAVGDGEVVVHDVELGEAGLGEHDLVGVRDANLAAADLEHPGIVLGGTHAFTLGRDTSRGRAIRYRMPSPASSEPRPPTSEITERVLVADEDLVVDEVVPEPLEELPEHPDRRVRARWSPRSRTASDAAVSRGRPAPRAARARRRAAPRRCRW